LRLLLIHADSFSYAVREKAVPNPETIDPSRLSGDLSELLVAFCTVEAEDEADPNEVAEIASKSIAETARTVRTQRVMIYPYAHLSSSLASRDIAINVLAMMELRIKSEGFEVWRSPFGYYKSFKLSCKGHPLSELSRTIRPGKKVAEPPKIQTKYMIMDSSGKLYDVKDYIHRPGEEEFKILVEKEALKSGLAGGEPHFLEYCKKFGIEWESYSDAGHMRYGPEASFMFELIGDYSLSVAERIGIPIFQIKGTNMFDLSVKAVKEHADLFGARLYKLDLDTKSFVLRYAACHQQFSTVKDWSISYRNMPFGTFEVADSYRLEQSGELLLCFRTRKLHMPDLHIYCTDLEEAKRISLKTHTVIYEEIRKLGRDYVSVYNTTKNFIEENKDFFLKLIEVERKPILINLVPEGMYYWVINVEYHIIDDLERPREIATFQIDVGNARRFGISYSDRNGLRNYPPIIHTATIGTVERYLFTLFDTCAKIERLGRKPMLPLWISPVQVRFIPVSREYEELALKLANKLNESGIRADIDDREESVQKRVRDAEMEWRPYIVVIGSREARGEKLQVRRRSTDSQVELNLDALIEEIREVTKGYPYRKLALPIRVSQRPGYKG
jgi:threonyl-tRNA synthetase